ncbi:RidA family protein [Pseudomonas sp. AD21]|uniref:RidA family protein n=1 Tax=Pseudomonas sp. AD21 TaxID=396378 RepID=UPI000C84DF96|nr:RidA family protein [Pseudomonas sp. AD21]
MSNTPEDRLSGLGLVLPPAPDPLARYRPARLVDRILYLSGQIPRRSDGSFITGCLGSDTTVEEGYDAARNVALQLLSVAKSVLGDLSRIEMVVKVTGMVNATPDFLDHARVVNGCSDLLIEILGESVGSHTRSAVGMGSLPFGASVEIEAIFAVKGN